MKTKFVIISVLAILFIIVCGINTTYAALTASIALSANSPTVPANGLSSVAITATLLDNVGMPSSGTAIFNTDLGQFANGTQISDVITIPTNGIIVVSLMAGTTPGTAHISCTSNFITNTTTVTFVAAGSISLTASPQWIPSDGASSSTLKATITNTDGTPVADGTEVTFSTTLGNFSNGLKNITVQAHVPTALSPESVLVSLIASTIPGIAVITCTSNYMTQTVTVAMGVGSITLTATPTSLPADGHSSSEIKAVVNNSAGVPVSKGTSVTFSTTLSGTLFSNGTQTITMGTIDASGIVTVALIAGTTSGRADVLCSSGGVTQSVSVNIGTLPIAAITLTANPTTLPADGTSSSTITATVLDSSGKPLNKEGVPVTFTTNLGHFSNGLQTVTVFTTWLDWHDIYVSPSDFGKVLVSLIAGTTPGVALIKCESGNVTQSINMTIGSPADVASIILSSNPTSLPADGGSSSAITATVLDASGNPLNKDGVQIKFTTTLGNFAAADGSKPKTITVSTTWVDPVWLMTRAGKVVVSLIAGKESGIALITCESGGVTQTTNVTIGTSGQVASITLSASPTSLPADGASSSTITAQLLDTSGNLINLSNIPVTFITTLGNFSNGTPKITVTSQSTTAVPGKVVVSLIAGTTSGIALITCRSGDVGGVGGVTQTTNVTIGSSAQVASITLSASPTSLPADGISSSTITALLKDITGSPVTQSNISVTFTTTQGLGHFSNGSNTLTVTTANSGGSPGAVVVSLIAGTTSGTAVITCASGGVTQATTITIGSVSTQVASITLTASPLSFSASDATLSSTITATLYTANGQPVSSGVLVSFATNLGFFSSKQKPEIGYTNPSGVAVAYVYSGGAAGTAEINVSAGGINRYVYVNFTGTGVGPPAIIYLNAAPERIPADGTYSVITAVIMDSAAQRVAAGTLVTFSTTKGVFGSGKDTYVVATPDSTGTLTVYLRAKSITATGYAVVTCKSGGVEQALIVQIVQLEYETEPNNDKDQADRICFDYMYLSQLFSPYDEDWYTFTITEPSRIGVNFITTAAPADASCDSGTTTVGTWKVDIRDLENNVLMSRHNIDCIFDNGIWETGVVPQGTYYVVVYCPRLGGGDYYLSDSYYMSVFNDFYFPCLDKDKQANSASLAQKASTYQLRVPIINTAPYFWADFQYDPIPGTTLMFRLSDLGVLTNLNNYRYCNLSILSLVGGNYVLHIPQLIYDGVSYRADLIYVPTTDGQIWFMLSGFWAN